MKNVFIIAVLIIIIAGGGYFFVNKEIAAIKSEIAGLNSRLQKVEEFFKGEEAFKNSGQLRPDADRQSVIKALNAMALKTKTLEDLLNKNISATQDVSSKQKKETEEALKKQAEAIEKINKESQFNTQKTMFYAAMANIRGHILKARVDLVAKNIGTAKNELELVNDIFEKTKGTVSNENKKTIEEMQVILKKLRGEIDLDLPAAINKIDLVWYEMSKALRKD